MPQQITEINLFYPFIVLIIISLGFVIYSVINSILNNTNSQDTTTKFKLIYDRSVDANLSMFNKNIDNNLIMFNKTQDNQKETINKLIDTNDNIVKLQYTSSEAREAHEFNKTLKEIKNTLDDFQKRLEILENKNNL